MGDKGQKSEKATPRRLDRARREGQFPTARQFVSAAQFLAFTAILSRFGDTWLDQTRENVRFLLRRAFTADLQVSGWVHLTGDLLYRMFLPLAVAGAMLVVVTLAAQMAVTRFGLSTKKLAPDVSRLSPLARLRELPRQNIPALIQALILLPLFGGAVYIICRDRFAEIIALPLERV